MAQPIQAPHTWSPAMSTNLSSAAFRHGNYVNIQFKKFQWGGSDIELNKIVYEQDSSYNTLIKLQSNDVIDLELTNGIVEQYAVSQIDVTVAWHDYSSFTIMTISAIYFGNL